MGKALTWMLFVLWRGWWWLGVVAVAWIAEKVLRRTGRHVELMEHVTPDTGYEPSEEERAQISDFDRRMKESLRRRQKRQ